MSAVPRTNPPDAVYYGLRMDADQFLAIGETYERYELINGVVCMSPRPTTLHQRLLNLVQLQLEPYRQSHPGVAHFAEIDLVLDPKTVYIPDLVAYRAGRIKGFPARLDIPPDLIVEILSPSTTAFDLTTKREDYGKFGVAEYLTFEPTDGRLRAFRPDGKVLVEAPAFAGDTFPSAGLPGFTLDLRPLRNPA